MYAYTNITQIQRNKSFNPTKGEVYNTLTETWGKTTIEEKESLMGYTKGTTGAADITDNQRAIRIGRALDGTTMR